MTRGTEEKSAEKKEIGEISRAAAGSAETGRCPGTQRARVEGARAAESAGTGGGLTAQGGEPPRAKGVYAACAAALAPGGARRQEAGSLRKAGSPRGQNEFMQLAR